MRGKTQITTFEFFVLKLIEMGLSTPYDLAKRAGISYGAAIPALKRLRERKLVRDIQAGAGRKRHEFTIAAAGAKYLKDEWRDLLARGAPDAESACRLAAMALWMDEDATAAQKILSNGAQTLRPGASTASVDTGGTDHLEIYRWMISRCEVERRLGESRALTAMARQLLKRIGHRRTSGRSR